VSDLDLDFVELFLPIIGVFTALLGVGTRSPFSFPKKTINENLHIIVIPLANSFNKFVMIYFQS
jgi:hypothetical protein